MSVLMPLFVAALVWIFDLSTASRHPGLAILIVQTNFPREKLAMVDALVFLLVNIVATIAYSLWAKRRQPLTAELEN